uniref:EF-hand domain-containing protein n=1 Tax=Anabas testudineus TaxID=64144 RepID=A0A7N6AKV5_ANATE
MEEAEHSHYVAQLKAEFDSCDTTATGFLDREELTVLCRKLQLDAHLPLLLDTLLRERTYARVNFEEFKEGFVAVLSRSLDFSTSEDDSSYLEPVVPEEVKPKFVKGTKRYGRRSRPDSNTNAALTCDYEDSPPSRTEATHSSPAGVRRAKLRRSTSLESVEVTPLIYTQTLIYNIFCVLGPGQEEAEPGVVGEEVLMTVCDHLGLQQLNTEELDVLLRKLDADLDGRVSIREFQKVLCGSVPVSCSTPVRPADLQRTVLEEGSVRSTSPSLLTATVGQRVLSQLDDGSGCTSPERVIALWTEEGIRNSRDILQVSQTLDFPLEERLSLADLTLALDNELLVSGNGIHQAALISYKNEIQHLQVMAEQACRERDKVKTDLDLADQRNLQLVREVDDRHASMETLNQSRIRDLEQDFRDRLTALRSQSEEESEALLQHVERERSMLQEELQLLRAQEVELQEELCDATQENSRLEEELSAVKLKLTEAEGSVIRQQRDLDQLLHDKLTCVLIMILHFHPHPSSIPTLQELRDRNDELSSELELLKSQRNDRKSRPSVDTTVLSWAQDSDSDDSDMKRSSSPLIRRKLQPTDETTLCSLESVSGPAVSIETELALEQLRQKHNQELQQLRIQLETQVNYYERSLELMRQSMEVERKDISQAFKLEISELEEQKAQVEQQVKQLKETVDKLQTQIQRGGGGWSNEQERRVQRERAELEQNFAREISNLVQRLSTEKDQLEAELKLKHDQEVMLVRTQLEEVRSENRAVQERLNVLQQEVQTLEDDVDKKRRKLEEMEREHKKSRAEEDRLHKENSKYREEVLDLSSRNLQLSNNNAELSARLHGDQESVRMLQEHLATISNEQEEDRATVRGSDEYTRKLMSEKEELRQMLGEQEEQASIALQEETHNLRVQNQDLQHKVSRPGIIQTEKTYVNQLRTCNNKVFPLQVVRADTALSLVQVQHLRQLQELQEHVGDNHREQVEQLQARLVDEQRRSRQLEETLRFQAQQSSSQISIKQDQYEKAMAALQQRTEDLESKLKGVRMVLQEKAQQLKEQLAKNSKSSTLLKEIYVENSQLMKALQVTEQRQKNAEKKNFLLEDKINALNKLLREIVPAALAT